MTDMETLQQKQGPSELIESPNACEEFRRGFEELVRDHLDSRMSLASCSGESGSGVRCGRCCRRCFDDGMHYESVDIRRLHDDMLEDEDDEGDQLVRRRRRSDLEGDDVAESSAARRRYSRILSRWAARQAQDMITTIERHNRERELMALSRLHAVSMLDSSFLRESTTSRGQAAVERPTTGASLIRQRWRELEDENMINHARDRANARHSDSDSPRYRRTGTVTPSNHGNEDSHGILSSTNISLSQASVQRGNSEVESVVSEENRWLEGDHNVTEVPRAGSESDYGIWSHGQADSQNDDDGNRTSSREPSPDLGEGERERVRQIFRGWMMENANESSTMSRRSSPRAELLGETERERVRLVREWVHMASQQRDARGRHQTLESADEMNSIPRQATGREEAVQGGLAGDGDERQSEHIGRDLLRLRGRQALLDLLVRVEEERQRELQRLLEHRAVSDFAHRNRIQSLLRGRFLRSGRSEDEERPPSLAARELGQLRQRQSVSGLRFQNIVRSQASNHAAAASDSVNVLGADQLAPTSVVPDAVQNESQPRYHESGGDQVSDHTEAIESNTSTVNVQEENLQEGSSEVTRRDWQESPELRVIERQDRVAEEPDGDWQNQPQDQALIDEVHDRDDGHLQEHGRWHDTSPQVAVDNWQEQHRNVSRMQRTSIRRINGFQPPDDDSVYSMELRELLSRRSVSNLLRSGFRESLDQLIQSYLQRQSQTPVDWDLQALGHHEASVDQTQDQPGEGGQPEDQPNPNIRPVVTLPPPPVPPPQPLWHRGLQATGWSRQSLHRSEMEWEIINDLRADMTRLQQGMNHMQRMLEACMDMQLELQRSIRQEVSAALNRDGEGKGSGEGSSLDGSKWGNVQKGLCCVCCDNNIDSLLYRCGHMCTCSKCANELVRGGGKCPLCRAPIVEVIRAYSIL